MSAGEEDAALEPAHAVAGSAKRPVAATAASSRTRVQCLRRKRYTSDSAPMPAGVDEGDATMSVWVSVLPDALTLSLSPGADIELANVCHVGMVPETLTVQVETAIGAESISLTAPSAVATAILYERIRAAVDAAQARQAALGVPPVLPPFPLEPDVPQALVIESETEDEAAESLESTGNLSTSTSTATADESLHVIGRAGSAHSLSLTPRTPRALRYSPTAVAEEEEPEVKQSALLPPAPVPAPAPADLNGTVRSLPPPMMRNALSDQQISLADLRERAAAAERAATSAAAERRAAQVSQLTAVLKTGLLHKKSTPQWFKRCLWQNRRFTLYQDRLVYSAARLGSPISDVFYLRDIFSVRHICFHHPQVKRAVPTNRIVLWMRHRQLILRARTHQEAKMWTCAISMAAMAVLKNSIDREFDYDGVELELVKLEALSHRLSVAATSSAAASDLAAPTEQRWLPTPQSRPRGFLYTNGALSASGVFVPSDGTTPYRSPRDHYDDEDRPHQQHLSHLQQSFLRFVRECHLSQTNPELFAHLLESHVFNNDASMLMFMLYALRWSELDDAEDEAAEADPFAHEPLSADAVRAPISRLMRSMLASQPRSDAKEPEPVPEPRHRRNRSHVRNSSISEMLVISASCQVDGCTARRQTAAPYCLRHSKRDTPTALRTTRRRRHNARNSISSLADVVVGDRSGGRPSPERQRRQMSLSGTAPLGRRNSTSGLAEAADVATLLAQAEAEQLTTDDIIAHCEGVMLSWRQYVGPHEDLDAFMALCRDWTLSKVSVMTVLNLLRTLHVEDSAWTTVTFQYAVRLLYAVLHLTTSVPHTCDASIALEPSVPKPSAAGFRRASLSSSPFGSQETLSRLRHRPSQLELDAELDGSRSRSISVAEETVDVVPLRGSASAELADARQQPMASTIPRSSTVMDGLGGLGSDKFSATLPFELSTVRRSASVDSMPNIDDSSDEELPSDRRMYTRTRASKDKIARVRMELQNQIGNKRKPPEASSASDDPPASARAAAASASTPATTKLISRSASRTSITSTGSQGRRRRGSLFRRPSRKVAADMRLAEKQQEAIAEAEAAMDATAPTMLQRGTRFSHSKSNLFAEEACSPKKKKPKPAPQPQPQQPSHHAHNRHHQCEACSQVEYQMAKYVIAFASGERCCDAVTQTLLDLIAMRWSSILRLPRQAAPTAMDVGQPQVFRSAFAALRHAPLAVKAKGVNDLWFQFIKLPQCTYHLLRNQEWPLWIVPLLDDLDCSRPKDDMSELERRFYVRLIALMSTVLRAAFERGYKEPRVSARKTWFNMTGRLSRAQLLHDAECMVPSPFAQQATHLFRAIQASFNNDGKAYRVCHDVLQALVNQAMRTDKYEHDFKSLQWLSVLHLCDVVETFVFRSPKLGQKRRLGVHDDKQGAAELSSEELKRAGDDPMLEGMALWQSVQVGSVYETDMVLDNGIRFGDWCDLGLHFADTRSGALVDAAHYTFQYNSGWDKHAEKAHVGASDVPLMNVFVLLTTAVLKAAKLHEHGDQETRALFARVAPLYRHALGRSEKLAERLTYLHRQLQQERHLVRHLPQDVDSRIADLYLQLTNSPYTLTQQLAPPKR